MKTTLLVTVLFLALAYAQIPNEANSGVYGDGTGWWNQNKTLGKTCTKNNNCTSFYCDSAAGTCNSPCAIYTAQGNWSNGCYCESNSDCSSQWCNNRQCQTIQHKNLGRYCNFDSDCDEVGTAFGGGVNIMGGAPNTAGWYTSRIGVGSNSANSDINLYWDCTRNTGGYCSYGKDYGQYYQCDFTKHECQPSCKIGGCFCTENR
jgi:hypothetical protein